jgi:hypothetical protein
MLRGDFRLPFTMFIVIMAFLGVFFAGVLFLKGIGDSAKVTANTMGYLNTVDAAHFVEECLSEGKDYISAGFLDSSTGNIADICMSRFPMLSEVSARAKVVDLEREVSGESKAWLFGWSGGSSDPSHQIYVSILDGDEVHVGRLHVQTKS